VVAGGRDQLDFAGASGRWYLGTRTSAQPNSNATQSPEKRKLCVILCDARYPLDRRVHG
jgi:hypothetical protein